MSVRLSLCVYFVGKRMEILCIKYARLKHTQNNQEIKVSFSMEFPVFSGSLSKQQQTYKEEKRKVSKGIVH